MDIQSKLIPLLRTLCITYLLSGLLLVIFSFIMYKCKLQESQMKIASYTIYTLSYFIGGFLSGKIAKKKATVAVARKLSGVIYALWQSDVAYDPHYKENHQKKQVA